MKNRIISLIVLTALVVVSCMPVFALADEQDGRFMQVNFDPADWTFDGDSISAKADSREIYCDTFSPRNAVYNKRVMGGDFVLTAGINVIGGGNGNCIILKVGSLNIKFGGGKTVYLGDTEKGQYTSKGGLVKIAAVYKSSGYVALYNIEDGSQQLVFEQSGASLANLNDSNLGLEFSWTSGSVQDIRMYKPFGELFEDNFDTGSVLDDDWYFADGAYAKTDDGSGNFRLTADGNTDGIAYIKPAFADGKYSVSMDIAQGDGDINYIYFNSITDSDFYALKIDGGNYSVLKEADELAAASFDGELKNVRIDVSAENDGDIEVYVNNSDTALLSANDTSYTMGRVGVCLGAQTAIDNVCVEVIDNSPEGRLKKAVKVFNADKTADKLKNIVNTYHEQLGVDIGDLDALGGENTDKIFESALGALSEKTTPKEIADAVNSRVAFALISQTGDVNVLLKYENYIVSEDKSYYDDWSTMAESEKEQICLKLKGVSDTEILAQFESRVILCALADTEWSGMKNKLEYYNASISADIAAADKTNAEAQKKIYTAFKDALTNGGIDSISDIPGKLDELVDKYKSYGEDSGGSSGGGSSKRGGGGSSGGKSYTVPVAEPKENTTEIPSLPFGDIADIDWAVTPIVKLWQDGIVTGKSEKTFAPYDDVTREEFVAIIVRSLKLASDSTDSGFTDVADGRWSAGAITAAKKAGIISGINDELFAPTDKITRQDMALIAMRAGEILDIEFKDGALAYADKDDIAQYAKDAVASLSEAKIINGANGRFEPMGYANRAQTAAVVYRLLQAMN